jgi:predicted Zn-dependent protease with MMP-like domain
MYRISGEEFQEIVEKSIEKIPEHFKNKLENIAFLVEDYPSQNDLDRLGIRNKNSLLGLYSGVPYTYRNTNYSGSMPDRIIIFRKNIEYISESYEELASKVYEVIVHEVAHYFGMDDREIRAAGF